MSGYYPSNRPATQDFPKGGRIGSGPVRIRTYIPKYPGQTPGQAFRPRIPIGFGKGVPPALAPFLRGGARTVGRIIPGIGTAILLYDIYNQIRQWNKPRLIIPGNWVQTKDCGLGPGQWIRGLHDSQTTDCGAGRNWYPEVPYSTNQVDISPDASFAAGYNPAPEYGWQGTPLELRTWWKFVAFWERVAPGPAPSIDRGFAQPLPDELYPWAPSLDPMRLPITQPAPAARPVPYRVQPYRQPSPYRAPTEQPIREEPARERRVATVPRIPAIVIWAPPVVPVPNPTRNPAPDTARTTDPVRNPAPDRKLEPKPSPKPNYPPPGTEPPHTSAPPGPKVKERKIKTPRGAKLALTAVSNFTEALDGIDAFYWALPKAVRKDIFIRAQKNGGHLGIDDKLSGLYRNFDKIDLDQAIDNLIKNQLQDGFIAKWSKLGRIPGGGIAKDVTRPGSGVERERRADEKRKDAKSRAIAKRTREEQNRVRDWYRAGR